MRDYVAINIVVCAVILIVSSLIIWLAKHFGKHLSIYKVFGTIDVIWGVIILIIAVVDIVTPGGDLNGLLGMVLLLIFEPAVILFLLADIWLYRTQLKRNN